MEKLDTRKTWATGNGQASGELGRCHVHSQRHAGICLAEDVDGNLG
jgi:hypothetical protein